MFYVMAWYCAYVLLMAINGITEALVHAVADQTTLSLFNGWLMICSICFVAASGALLPFGAVGLVFANCVNMIARILFSARYISSNPNLMNATRNLFSSRFVGSTVVSYVAMLISNKLIYTFRPSRALYHVTVGAACALFVQPAAV